MNVSTNEDRRRYITAWYSLSRRKIDSAKLVFTHGDYRTSATCSYYAAYAAATARAIQHGDEDQFPFGWNNPSHEQLPDLIRNNGSLPQYLRRRIIKDLNTLRSAREIADYRALLTVDRILAANCLHTAANVQGWLGVEFNDGIN